VSKPVGRPLKFKTPELMQVEIDNYFNRCVAEDEPYTITGLALALDTTRETLIDYQNRDEFTDTVKKAKLRVENDYEIALRKHGRAGEIFGLKNFGWEDKATKVHEGELSIKKTKVLQVVGVGTDTDPDTK
jgi:hypothetical protein